MPLRQAWPIPGWLDGDPGNEGGPIGSLPTRLTAGADRSIPAGRRGVSISVMVAAGSVSPVLTTDEGSAVLPAGFTAVFACDYPNDTLGAMDVTTVAGDDVMIIETVLL
jgi:hypothetical protein